MAESKRPPFEKLYVRFGLNYVEAPNRFANWTIKRKKLDMKWDLPNNTNIALSDEREASGSAVQFFENLFCRIRILDAVYPFWCYNVEHFGAGSLFIIIEDVESVDTVKIVHDFSITKNPRKVTVFYLNIKQLQNFLRETPLTDQNKQNVIRVVQEVYNKREDGKIAEMCTWLCADGQGFSSLSTPRAETKPFKVGCKLFQIAMDAANIKMCHMLELDLGRKEVRCCNMKARGCAWVHCKKDSAEFRVCKGCKLALYCCRDHQKRDWNAYHRHSCKR